MGFYLHDDVRTLTAARLREVGAWPVDVVVGSPPCQDASLANSKGRGVDGERTGLFFEAIRLVDECRPAWCCFENVPGLRTRGADRVLAALEEIGYTTWPLVVGAWHAGAPHRRNRVWIVAADVSRLGSDKGGRGDLIQVLRGNKADSRMGSEAAADAVRQGQQLAADRAAQERGARQWTECGACCRRRPSATGRMAGRARRPHARNAPSAERGCHYKHGITGTAALLTLVEWMMGYPKGWLGTASPPTATPSSRK